ncbi:paraquat-inducible protein A [Oceaniglobus ichthyenteri]|uniref:paraquat-inducible protein A n=1 Tax=Oceaniglobus ichthyenteri TaxID=2136177 RepID=UPI000D3CA60A|nr:paraquat-inducible protein A [Oceaniglobus ichthyenteri]
MNDSLSFSDNAQEMIACPQCDALHCAEAPRPGERAMCVRCHTVLIQPHKGAGLRVIAMSLGIMILMLGATFFPFLQVRVAGLKNASSVFDAALAFMDGPMVILSVMVTLLIVLIPILRAFLVVYVLTPVVFDRAPWSRAAMAFRWAEALRPWSMAEIFVIGVAVALVKVSDLARVDFGPAFWMFAALVVVSMFQDGYMCRWSIWKSLDQGDRA